MGTKTGFWLSLMVAAVAPALQTAHAGDQKQSQRGFSASVDQLVSATGGGSGSHHMINFPMTRADGLEARSVHPGGGDDHGFAPQPKYHSLTIARFNTGAGEVAVQPVLNGIKGVQFSLGF